MSATKHYLKKLMPNRFIQGRLHKKVFLRFAERNGFVYFGLINQRQNDRRLVRGLTLSKHHRDDHYCLGSFKGYDVSIVERTSVLAYPGHPVEKNTWLIVSFDLRAFRDAPHLFFANTTHGQAFYRHVFTNFSTLSKVEFDESSKYSAPFLKRRTLYANPYHYPIVAALFVPRFANAVHERLGSLTFEVSENVLYLYGEHQRPSVALLERMLQHGAWLASELDERIK